MNRLENSTSRQQLVGYLQAWARSLLFPFIPVTKTPIQNCLLKYCSHIQEIWFSFLCQKNSIYSLKQALRAFQSAVHGALDTGDEKSQVRLTFKVEGDKGTHQLINLQHAIPLNGFRSSNSYYLSFLYLCCPNCGWLYRARNNFGTVVGHDNQLKKLLLSWVSFLTCPNIQIGKKRFTFMRNFLSVSMIVFLQRQNLRFTAGRIWLFFQVWEWHDWWMTREWSFWLVKPPFWLDIVRWPAVILSLSFINY